MPLKPYLNPSKFPTTQRHIGIVGAGLAGLRCADVFLRYGYRVTILEARDRIGGRVHQISLREGSKVDTGAAWFHGTQHNAIYDIAIAQAVTTADLDEHEIVYDARRQRWEPDYTIACSTELWDRCVPAAMQLSETEGRRIPVDDTLAGFVARQSTGDDDELSQAARCEVRTNGRTEVHADDLLSYAQCWAEYTGLSLSRQSVRAMSLERTLPGETLFNAATYAGIIDKVAGPALEGADVKLNHAVTQITSRHNTLTGRVLVKTTSGQDFEFNQVVITTPLGWLKRNRGAFTPPIKDACPRLDQAIDNLGYGKQDKVFFTFPRAFWADHDCNDESPTCMRWLPSDVDATYCQDEPSGWAYFAASLASLPAPFAQSTLVFFTYGGLSQNLSTLLAKTAAQQHSKVLMDHFEPFYSCLPGYNPSDPSCTPAAAHATNWTDDEYAGKGSFTVFPAGINSAEEDIAALRHGMPDRGIWFAGEHTAPLITVATVTGAYESGEDVARRIAASHGVISTSEMEKLGDRNRPDCRITT